MAQPNETFLQAVAGLWFRLTTLFAAASLIALTLILFPGKALGWLYYLTFAEAGYEAFARALLVCVAAAALAALWSAAAAPFLYRKESRAHAMRTAIRAAAGTAVFADLFVALLAMSSWAHLSGAKHSLAVTVYIGGFAAALWNRRFRRRLTSRFDGVLSEQTPRYAMAALALCFAVAALSARSGAVPVAADSARAAGRPHTNILLITFDALSAEDMALYGYRLPTTPHIDEFAANGLVAENFFSASTFTTPSLASVLTGLEPSESGVYHLPGRLRGPLADETFPRVLREAGYTTGAAIASPMAYFLASWQNSDFDFLEGPVYRTRGFLKVWDTLALFHPPRSFGSRLDEFQDAEKTWRFAPLEVHGYEPSLFTHSHSEYPPEEVFGRARNMLRKMPDGFFLWVHVLAPHYPYLPSAHLGQFLPGSDMRTAEQQISFSEGQTYRPDQQPEVDKARLRYDEFIADADSAFGDFLAGLRADGRMENTAVIVSADHGESFQGGVYKHDHPFQIRPEIHIPLIIRLPGQTRGARVRFAADQTALAPTILDIAGLPRAAWMQGLSLTPWLKGDAPAEDRGLAFTEYLETSSIFRTPDSGTAGVTDGVHQYLVNLATGKGTLRNLAQPAEWNVDRTMDNPDAARELRAAIAARFPGLQIK
jgi:arylsulfatase A-like enzyme